MTDRIAHFTDLCRRAKDHILSSEMSPCPDKHIIDTRIAQEHARIILTARVYGLERQVFDACTPQWGYHKRMDGGGWVSSSAYSTALESCGVTMRPT
jgi:hypothetical protein